MRSLNGRGANDPSSDGALGNSAKTPVDAANAGDDVEARG
jgi:hypothetical protein